jgi:hypothetical protein
MRLVICQITLYSILLRSVDGDPGNSGYQSKNQVFQAKPLPVQYPREYLPKLLG